tara:strand:- start:143 stop:433 length:291 start_codon:yes stop_codon:yes gene_type:complete
MRVFLFIILLAIPSQPRAEPAFWISNKVEAGYGKIFLGEKITIERGMLVKNSISTGLKFKILKNIEYRMFYLLENSKRNSWLACHFAGTSLSMKFQ